MTARMAVFMFVVPVLWMVFHVYLGRRLVGGSGLRGRARTIAWGLVGVMALLPPITFLALRRAGVGPWSGVQWLGYLFMGVSSIVFILVVVLDVFRLGRKLALKLRPAGPSPEAAPDGSRRAFLGRAVNLGIVGGAASVTGVGVVQAQMLPTVVEVDVPIAGLSVQIRPTPRGYPEKRLHACEIRDGPVINWLQTLRSRSPLQARL